MKKLFIYSAALFSLAILSGCGDDRTTLTDRTKEVFDMGAAPVPNKPGYTLHGYRLINGMTRDHYVYVLEKDAEPVAGTSMNYDYRVQSGKTSTTHTESISSVVAPSAAPAAANPAAPAGAPAKDDTCHTVEDCQAKIDAMTKAPSVSQLAELQQRYQEMQRQ